MWSTPSDRAVAEAIAKRERQACEHKRTVGMSVAARIERWLEEDSGDETEAYIDLLVDAKYALLKLAKAGKP